MGKIDNIRKDLEIRHDFDIRLQLQKIDSEYNALSAAQILLPYLEEDQWIKVTTSQEEEDHDNKWVDIDMEEGSSFLI